MGSFTKAINRVENELRDVQRELTQFQGSLARCDEGSYEASQFAAQIRKLENKINRLNDQLTEMEDDYE
jgi:DNA repair exonuclease SbcCD ATPase subunit